MWKVKNVFLLICCTVFFGNSSGEISEEAKTATNQFSLDLLKTVLENKTGNAVVSPVSVYTLLAILQQGAGGNTQQEVNNVVHAQPEITKLAYKTLTTRYKGSFPRQDLEFATRAFADATFQLKSDFKQTLINDFLSDIDTVDFNSSENAAAHINNWVSQATKQLIPKLFEPNDISPPTALVLVNALYFKNHWDNPFISVRNKAFSPSNGVEIQVPTLSQVEVYYAGQCACIGVKYVHLDFVGTSDFTVLLVQSTEKHGLDNMLNQMTAQNLTNIIKHTGQKRVNLQVPKFRLKTDSNLSDVLKKLGMTEAFQDNANLSNITDQQIKVDSVIQKANIALDEHGVTAAAATGMTFHYMMAIIHPTVEDMDFIADHPFLFFIVDRANHVPLFAGRVTNPSSQ
ncbi:hypothetical protein L9F63_020614 [Diploptera punctata]|uniref:Serpin domain-containing protein n=1 Tax=Diploptera punctata TaxID=6984 RepID=A0AAD8EC47_DIPPU|nr:hypothetical protein L9F63_020614 [Diploptera punctata]